MLRYSDIIERYKALAEVQDQCCKRMRNAAAELFEELQDSLQLPTQGWIDSEGNQRTYLDIGFEEKDGRFRSIPPQELRGGADFLMNFSILIIFQDETKHIPAPGCYAQHVTLRETSNSLEIKMDGPQKILMHVSKTPAERRFADVIESMKLFLIEHMDSKMQPESI